MKVGIIDTGICIHHPDLKDRIAACKNFTYEPSCEDENGHGSHTAGIIAASCNGRGVVGVAPRCWLYVAKAFDKNGMGSACAVLKSMEWLLREQVHIINMSFSTKQEQAEEENMVREAEKSGCILISAAGNWTGHGGRDTVGFPAKREGVIGVAAIDQAGRKTPFSASGDSAQVSAVGTDILSTYKESAYACLSGTSMASPLIAGAAALLQQKAYKQFHRFLNRREMEMILGMYASKGNHVGETSKYGIFSFNHIFNKSI